MLKKNWQAIILKDFKENKSNRPSWKKMFVRIKSINSVETRHSTMTWVWLLFCCSCRICVSYPTLNCNKPYPLQSGLRELPWIQSRSFLQVQSSKCECILFIFFHHISSSFLWFWDSFSSYFIRHCCAHQGLFSNIFLSLWGSSLISDGLLIVISIKLHCNIEIKNWI